MNIFSPYEAAKRLGIESKSLVDTSERYMEFLSHLKQMDTDYETQVVSNFEKEY